MTGPLLKLLRSFLEEPSADIYGLQLVRATGLKSGTVYPILDRLETEGWVESRWEAPEPTDLGRPRRHLYRLTAQGVHEARQVMLEYAAGDLQR